MEISQAIKPVMIVSLPSAAGVFSNRTLAYVHVQARRSDARTRSLIAIARQLSARHYKAMDKLLFKVKLTLVDVAKYEREIGKYQKPRLLKVQENKLKPCKSRKVKRKGAAFQVTK